MEFRWDKHSDLPVVAQLQEQIKIALLLGRLRPGDTLPSIRDVEKQLGVSRNFVRQAYVSLEKSGILTLHHGKGVLVQKQLNYNHKANTLETTEHLVQEFLKKAEELGAVPSAFARYLYQRAVEAETSNPRIVYADVGPKIAAERAAYISSFWRMNIPSISLDELARSSPSKLRHIRRILTNYMRYDEVRAMVKNKGIKVIPLGLVFTEEAIVEFSRLPRNSSVLFVYDDRDDPWLKLIAQSYKQVLSEPSVEFITKPFSQVKDLEKLVRSRRYSRVVVSNRLWEKLPEKIYKMRGITRPHLQIDLASLEEARIGAGVIV